MRTEARVRSQYEIQAAPHRKATELRENARSDARESPARARSAIEKSTADARSPRSAGSAPSEISPSSRARAKRARKALVNSRSAPPSFVFTESSRAASVAAVPIRKQPSGEVAS